MTIDERLEAIAMHLEVLTRVHEDYEKNNDARFEAHIKSMTEFAASVTDSIARLTRIAEAHERRIGDLEQ